MPHPAISRRKVRADAIPRHHRWIPISHRWLAKTAWVLACATFALICTGALVTTFNAGMALPDWSDTDLFNLFFFYPLTSWLKIWDVFLEHSHRLIGAVVWMITIGLAVLLWLYDRRRWMVPLAAVSVAGVSLEGTLGGLRVVAGEILFANIHACTAPLFFALATALVTLTSRAWLESRRQKDHTAARQLQRFAAAATVGIYLQIVLGAQLRHLPPDASVGWFQLWVWLHLIVAGLVLLGTVWLLILAHGRFRGESMILRRAWLLAVLFSLQILLGAGTWVTNYGFPAWFTNYIWALGYTVVAEGPLQAVTTALHVAVGSLNLVTGLSLVLWSRRVLRPPVEPGSRRGA